MALHAKAGLFLASDDSSFVTSIKLFVDGGRAQIELISAFSVTLGLTRSWIELKALPESLLQVLDEDAYFS